MSAAVQAQYPEEDSYEDEFEDDFESDSSPESTPHRVADAVEKALLDKAAHSSHRTSSSSSSSSKSSSDSSSSSAHASPKPSSAAVAARHAEEVVSHHSSSSSSSSHHTSFSSHSHHSAKQAADNFSELEESGRDRSSNIEAAAYPAETQSDHGVADRAVAAASESSSARRADGTTSEPRSTGQKHKTAAATNKKRGAAQSRRSDRDAGAAAAAPEKRRVQRPEVPRDAEELAAMQQENAKLRDQLFEKNREQYHAALSQSTKGGAGGMGATNATTATMGGSTAAGNGGGHRDAAARLVQDSLMAHRTLQTLRQEQRDLTQRRDELKKLISQYKRASKYRGLVEDVKQDILAYQEEHRDVQLEVRSNEKLLLLAEHMAESGVGDRRVQEEIRAQNALTQRRREHALRDADAAQRKHDAAAQRVDELKAELERRQENAHNRSGGEAAQLRADNQRKRERIRELRGQLQDVEQPSAKAGGATRSPQSKRDDAEREYLQSRIAEMQRELQAMGKATTGATTTTPPSTSANSPGSSAVLHQQQRQQQSVSPPPPSSSHDSRGAHTPADPHAHNAATEPPVTSSSSPAAAAPAQTEEFDVSAWLNAHPATVAAASGPTDPAETQRYTAKPAYAEEPDEYPAENGAGAHPAEDSSLHHNTAAPSSGTTATAATGAGVYIPPVPQPPYAQEEPAAEHPSADLAVPRMVDDTPAWLAGGAGVGGGGAEENTALNAHTPELGVTDADLAGNSHVHSGEAGAHGGSAYPGEHSAAAQHHGAEEEEEEVFEEEEVADDAYEEMDEPEEPQYPTSHEAEVPAEAPKDDDGPDWLNF